MAGVPLRRRDPEAELRALRKRFRAVSRGCERRAAFRRIWRLRLRLRRVRRPCARPMMPAALLLAVVVGGLLSFQPWPMSTALRHLAAAPGCAAARAVGLAPASRGQPGYWGQLDGDADGVSCEPGDFGRDRPRYVLVPVWLP
jgi:hypothetical protein